MKAKVLSHLTKSYKETKNSLGSKPNKGGKGNPESYNSARVQHKTGKK